MSTVLQIIAWVIGIALSGIMLYGVHRGLISLEKRGYIYYLEKPRGGGGAAFLEMDRLIRPSVEYHQDAKDKKPDVQDVDGE